MIKSKHDGICSAALHIILELGHDPALLEMSGVV